MSISDFAFDYSVNLEGIGSIAGTIVAILAVFVAWWLANSSSERREIYRRASKMTMLAEIYSEIPTIMSEIAAGKDPKNYRLTVQSIAKALDSMPLLDFPDRSAISDHLSLYTAVSFIQQQMVHEDGVEDIDQLTKYCRDRGGEVRLLASMAGVRATRLRSPRFVWPWITIQTPLRR